MFYLYGQLSPEEGIQTHQSQRMSLALIAGLEGFAACVRASRAVFDTVMSKSRCPYSNRVTKKWIAN
jgi:hypothetical protein